MHIPAHTTAEQGLPTYAASGADGALEVVDTSELAVRDEVVIWLDLVQVAHAVDVAWVIHKFVGFEEESREH